MLGGVLTMYDPGYPRREQQSDHRHGSKIIASQGIV
jgi:hypothetical protein